MTEQEENQVRAALAFWAAVARTSRVHPSEHPACRKFFEDHRPLPVELVEELSLAPFSSVREDRTLLREATEGTGISVARLRYRLRKNGVRPHIVGGLGFYPHGAVAAAVRELLAKEGVFKRRYRLDEIVDPETSEAKGNRSE